MEFSESDKQIISSIVKVGQELKEKLKERAVVISFSEFYSYLNEEQVNFCKKMIALDPLSLGFKGKHLGVIDAPTNIVAVRDQAYTYKGESIVINTQFLPKPAYDAVVQLQNAIQLETGKKLLIASAYRAPAYQLFLFLYYLESYNFDIYKNATRVALPGYSEHGDINTALDFITEDGIPDDEHPLEFANTPEYTWLLENANKFGFHLSYPENNDLGVMFEPWHWRYKGE